MSRTITGIVFDPYEGTDGPVGVHKYVKQNGIAWPYHGDASYGERVTFQFELEGFRE